VSCPAPLGLLLRAVYSTRTSGRVFQASSPWHWTQPYWEHNRENAGNGFVERTGQTNVTPRVLSVASLSYSTAHFTVPWDASIDWGCAIAP